MRKLRSPLLALAAVAIASVSSSAPAAAIRIDCQIRAPAVVAAGKPVLLRFQLRNMEPDPLMVLTWNTPLEGWFGVYFEVKRTGESIPYRGPMIKRGLPAAEDYIRIRPGAKATATVDLTQVYDLSRKGRYHIQFNGSLHDVLRGRLTLARPERSELALTCPSLEIRIADS